MRRLVTHQHVVLGIMSGKRRDRRGEDILGPGSPYSIALCLRASSNEGLLVALLLYGTVQVVLEECIHASLVYLGDAQLFVVPS
jgi:hypothetical protein